MTRPGAPGLSILAAACLLAAPALGQVTVNPGALDAPTAPTPRTTPAVRPPLRPGPARPGSPAGPQNPPVAAGKPAVQLVPGVSANAPPLPVVPPAVVVPLARPVPLPPIPITADAPGGTAPLPGGGLRVTFGPDRQDFAQATVDAIRSYGDSVKATAAQAVNVMAYAAGAADDPSTPRRLSLARGLSVRAVLINDGLPSTRIYVRALGSAVADGPADRVDIMPAAAPTPPPTPAATPAPTTTQSPAPAPASNPAPARK